MNGGEQRVYHRYSLNARSDDIDCCWVCEYHFMSARALDHCDESNVSARAIAQKKCAKRGSLGRGTGSGGGRSC